jgi:hypothetical protein
VYIAATDRADCAVSAFHRLFVSHVAGPDAPLFNVGSDAQPHCSSPEVHLELRQRLHRAGVIINLADKRFTGHSFRSGGATDAAKRDTTGQLKLIGRWTSTAYIDYVKVSEKERLEMSRTFLV